MKPIDIERGNIERKLVGEYHTKVRINGSVLP